MLTQLSSHDALLNGHASKVEKHGLEEDLSRVSLVLIMSPHIVPLLALTSQYQSYLPPSHITPPPKHHSLPCPSHRCTVKTKVHSWGIKISMSTS